MINFHTKFDMPFSSVSSVISTTPKDKHRILAVAMSFSDSATFRNVAFKMKLLQEDLRFSRR
jgi:hypothetical protein